MNVRLACDFYALAKLCGAGPAETGGERGEEKGSAKALERRSNQAASCSTPDGDLGA